MEPNLQVLRPLSEFFDFLDSIVQGPIDFFYRRVLCTAKR